MSEQRSDAGSRALRIAHVIRGMEQYGPRRAAIGLASGLRDAGHDMRFVALADGAFADELEQRGFAVDRLGLGEAPGIRGSLRARARAFAAIQRFRRRAVPRIVDAARGSGADVLHVRWPTLVPIAGAAGRRLGLPTVWLMPNIVGGGYPFDINRRLYRRQCERLDILPVGNSRFTVGTLGGVPASWLHLGVDPAEFDPDGPMRVTRAGVGLPEGVVVVGIFGRLDPNKGQARVVEAIGLLGRDDVHLYLLGGAAGDRQGSHADVIRARAEAAGVADRVHLGGRVPDPAEHYKLLDISMNARVDPEPFGLSVVESLMMKRPIIVHASGGPSETVRDGETGWHVTDPTPSGFAAGLERALADRERWPTMGDAARADALARFSVEAYVRGYVSIVDRLAHEGRRSFPVLGSV